MHCPPVFKAGIGFSWSLILYHVKVLYNSSFKHSSHNHAAGLSPAAQDILEPLLCVRIISESSFTDIPHSVYKTQNQLAIKHSLATGRIIPDTSLASEANHSWQCHDFANDKHLGVYMGQPILWIVPGFGYQ